MNDDVTCLAVPLECNFGGVIYNVFSRMPGERYRGRFRSVSVSFVLRVTSVDRNSFSLFVLLW